MGFTMSEGICSEVMWAPNFEGPRNVNVDVNLGTVLFPKRTFFSNLTSQESYLGAKEEEEEEFICEVHTVCICIRVPKVP